MMGDALKERVAVQLYTVRDQMTKDSDATLRAVRDMGWTAVEVAGFPYEPETLARSLGALGMRTAAIHIPHQRLTGDPDGVVREARALGAGDIVCPFIAPGERTDDGYKRVQDELRVAREQLAREGIRLSYHNHAFEFEPGAPGGDALRYILDGVPGLTAEADVYWLARGGHNPVEYMRGISDRVEMLHLKDVNAEDGSFAEVGAGTLDMPGILRFGREAGVRWFIVEQDRCPGDPLDSLQISWTNLNRMLDVL